MAGQELGISMKTTTDVPQAMDKAKGAVQDFDKQLGDIGNKFKTSFKDIFLGFTAPMVLLQSAISAISSAIEKAKQDAKEGLDIIAKGETLFASREEAQLARFLKIKAATEKEQELVEKGRREMTEQFLTQTDAGKAIVRKKREEAADDEIVTEKVMSIVPTYQKMALEAFLNSEEGKKYKPLFEAEQNQLKPGTFKGPEGFGSVIGVGANPVMEKMTRQNELLEEIRLILEQQYIDNRNGTVPDPFTERLNAPTLKQGLA